MSLVAQLVIGLQLTLAVAGALLLWRLVLSPAARASQPPTALPPWRATPLEFLAFLAFVIGGSLLGATAGVALGKVWATRGDSNTVLMGAFAQLGMLAGVLAFQRAVVVPTMPSERGPNVFVAGTVTFLLSLPLLLVTAKLSEVLLRLLGLPTERQDLVGIFAGAESPLMIAIMVTLAVVIAPLNEELVFRAGLYRIARGVLPRWVALLAPAIIFAALHVNWRTLQGLASLAPLALLAVVFALAYERTGKIGTPIVAHALFNLNTVVLIYSGVGDV